MDRRKAIKLGLGVSAGMTLGAATGCAPLRREVTQGETPEKMNDFLGNLDLQLHKIREGRFVEGFAGKATGKVVTPELRVDLAPLESQFQNILHTLLLTQSFRDLSEEGQFHPEMQKRMAENMESINSSVLQVNDMLANLDANQREATRTTLQKHPGLAMQLAESLDEQAALAGVSTARRTQLRSIMTQTSFRLTNNDPSIVIDEYVKKVRRASEPSAAQISNSQSAGYIGGEAFWRYHDQVVKASEKDLGGSAFKNGPEQAPAQRRNASERTGIVGLKMMGIGALTFGISAIFVSNGVFPFLFGMTVGAVLFALGLITLIIAAIISLINN